MFIVARGNPQPPPLNDSLDIIQHDTKRDYKVSESITIFENTQQSVS